MRPLTRSCFRLLLLGRLSLPALPHLLGTCLPSLWSQPFPLHAPALILLSLIKVRLFLTLTLSPLMIWCFGQTVLFLFSFGKHGFGILANCSLCGTEAPLSFSAVPVCSSFSPEACAILQDLCWSRHRKHQQVCHFSYLILCPRHLVFSIFAFTSIFLGRSGRNCLFSFVLSRYNGSPGTRFFWGTTQLMSWQDGKRHGALLTPSVILCGLLLFLISTLVFSRAGGVLSHQNSLTHKFPRFPPRNLCSLVMFAVFSLVFAATDTVYC